MALGFDAAEEDLARCLKGEEIGDGTAPPDAVPFVGVVIRNQWDEATVAVVRARLVPSDPEETLSRQFLSQLKGALAAWIDGTVSGRKAWEQSCRDFNVGDLALYAGDPELVPLLAAHGIYDLSVDCYSGDTRGWVFDECLYEEK